jgi:hypothetical protein
VLLEAGIYKHGSVPGREQQIVRPTAPLRILQVLLTSNQGMQRPCIHNGGF